MTIRSQQSPDFFPQPEFSNELFSAAVWQKGYDVIVEEAYMCPCKSENGFVSTCQNCKGTGWVFVNPIQTRAIVTSINERLQYKQWSQEALDDILVTLQYIDRLAYMDRISFVNDTSLYSEVCQLRTSGDERFIFTTYEPSEIESVLLFSNVTTNLVRLTSDDYEISTNNSGSVVITYNVSAIPSFNNQVSIRYKHTKQYHVLNTPHDLRSQMRIDVNGQEEKINLPINALCRTAHQLLSRKNFDGTGLLDNSWKI